MWRNIGGHNMWPVRGCVILQANFSSLESLVAKIHEDKEIAEKALELPRYSMYKDDPYLNFGVNEHWGT